MESLVGRKFGRLTVLKYDHKNAHREPFWLCECECGNTKVVIGANLKNGTTKSCGCYQRERSRNFHQTHGMRYTKIHGVWSGMIERCENPNHKDYSNYGGRGITVCEKWRKDFVAFQRWAVSNGYSDGTNLTLDRISCDGNYCPENCRFITPHEQARNKRNNRYYLVDGEKMLLGDIAKKVGTTYRKLDYRTRIKGMTIQEALDDLRRK